MQLNAIKNQLLHDLKASWQKTALLGILFLIGLIFWVPPMVRAFNGGSAAKPSTTTTAAPNANPNAAPANVTSDAKPSTPTFSWEQAEKARATDPSMKSVDVAAIHGDPFYLDRDQFSPPLAFEDEPVREVTLTSAEPTDATLTEKLVLKSTIVGAKRRAALINDKLYHEGRTITVDGQSFVLTSVQPRRVLLTQGETVFELTIPTRYNGNGDE